MQHWYLYFYCIIEILNFWQTFFNVYNISFSCTVFINIIWNTNFHLRNHKSIIVSMPLPQDANSISWPTIGEVKQIADIMNNLSAQEVSTYRRVLCHDMNGIRFSHAYFWPPYIKRSTWKKPMTRTDMLKCICFFMGNNCNSSTVYLIIYWLCSSLCWGKSQDRSSRCEYLHWVLMKMYTNQHRWFFYDIQKRGYYFLDGRRKFWKK